MKSVESVVTRGPTRTGSFRLPLVNLLTDINNWTLPIPLMPRSISAGWSRALSGTFSRDPLNISRTNLTPPYPTLLGCLPLT